MKYFTAASTLRINVLMILSVFAYAQKIDIQKEVQNNNVEVYNREIDFINEESYPGIRLNATMEDGVAWLKNMEFANGTIEFDVRGKNIRSHSFVGIAFHGQDSVTYDAIYFRPFRFPETEVALRNHSVQYISLPNYTWQVLREKFPNKFENRIEPSPDPDAWFHVKVVIKDSQLSTYVNNDTKPCLVVDKMSPSKTGKLGFYVADTSDGDFANLKITKSN